MQSVSCRTCDTTVDLAPFAAACLDVYLPASSQAVLAHVCRLVFEAAIVITVSPWTKDYTINGIPLPINSSLYTAAKPPQNCFRWSDQYTCWTDEWVLIGTILLMLCVGLYFFLYLICMARVHLQLSRQPYTVFRAANILYQLQVTGLLPSFRALHQTSSTALLAQLRPGSPFQKYAACE